ncbi:unnamed protein product [Pleuronectes platessa]|uniref:Uncharacterized protein n=1 Tax=Pleuronectes platessa TaxID=8262 RepID=A0A9N7UIL9_PLEPL|nr:unnamed protein product [Pleuronectes platessa]
MALFERLECSSVHGASTRMRNPRLHQGRERRVNLGQTSTPDREAKPCCNNGADKHFTLFNDRSYHTFMTPSAFQEQPAVVWPWGPPVITTLMDGFSKAL